MVVCVCADPNLAHVAHGTGVVRDREVRLSALDVVVAAELSTKVHDEHLVRLGSAAAIVADGQQAGLVGDEVAQGFVVHVLDVLPGNPLGGVFLLLGLQGQFDENLLQLLVHEVDAHWRKRENTRHNKERIEWVDDEETDRAAAIAPDCEEN
jgi:hypothetical protein